jgi:hypothetical protein
MFLYRSSKTIAFFFILCVVVSFAVVSHAEVINLGSLNEAQITKIISSAKKLKSPGAAIVSLSGHFKGFPYAEGTLSGGPNDPEELILELSRFDCFTFLDVVEALRRSSSYNDFSDNLQAVRYLDGTLAYEKRRHFFSDWLAGQGLVEDVTAKIGVGSVVTVDKQLNLKDDSTLWLPGIAVTSRQVRYIPTSRLNREILNAIAPGDYVGIYSPLAGLDVSHTGIIVKDSGSVFIRHASSRKETGQVVDEDLLQYLQDRPGLVIYRAKP